VNFSGCSEGRLSGHHVVTDLTDLIELLIEVGHQDLPYYLTT